MRSRQTIFRKRRHFYFPSFQLGGSGNTSRRLCSWLPLSASFFFFFWRVMYRVLIISKFPWDGTEKCRRPDRCVKFASFDWKVITATCFFATQFPLIWFRFQLMYWLVGVSKFFFPFSWSKTNDALLISNF